MKLIKLVVISAVILFLLITALSLLLPSHVRISRAINIEARGQVLPYVASLRQWIKWNTFVQRADSAGTLAKITDTLLVAGQIEIKLVNTEGVAINTMWKQPNGKPAACEFLILPGDNYNVVQWYFDFNLDWYPWQKFQSIVYDKQLGPSMELSLEQLKKLVEAQQ
jgi:hypothetical protein